MLSVIQAKIKHKICAEILHDASITQTETSRPSYQRESREPPRVERRVSRAFVSQKHLTTQRGKNTGGRNLPAF